MHFQRKKIQKNGFKNIKHLVKNNSEFIDRIRDSLIQNFSLNYLRNKLNINPNSDKDDIIYSQIWMTISLHNNKIRTNLNK